MIFIHIFAENEYIYSKIKPAKALLSLNISPKCGAQYRGMEQLVAREDHSLEVSGSSPLPATQDNIEIININLSIKTSWIENHSDH